MTNPFGECEPGFYRVDAFIQRRDVPGKPGATITRFDSAWGRDEAPSYVVGTWKATRVTAQFSSAAECEAWLDRDCPTISL